MTAAKEAALSALDAMGPFGTVLAGVAVAAGAAGFALFEMADKAAQAGEAVLQFSRVTGTAIDEVGGISAAATIAGGSLDSLQQMATQMQRRLDATGPSADKFNAALADLGINAMAFRAADPTDRINMLSAGMQASAGSTNLMSDALAIMGRAGVQNIGFLMEYTDEARDKGDALGMTWDTVTTKSAVDLGIATRTTGVELSTLANTVGVALIPAVTVAVEGFNRTILALEHVADLGGLVSGTWDLITGALGKTALADQTYAATADTVNALWTDAAKRGLDLSDATYDVATHMLALGYSTTTVSEQTGLYIGDVQDLKKGMDDAAQGAQAFADSQDRVNKLMYDAKPSIVGVSDSVQGWVIDMQKANVTMADMVEQSGLTAGQISLIIDAQTKADKAAKALDASFVKWALDAEKAATQAAAALAKETEDSTKNWALYDATVASLSGSTLQAQEAHINQWVADQIASHVKAKTDTADFYSFVYAQADAMAAKDAHDAAVKDVNSKAYADKQVQDAKDALARMLADYSDYTDTDIRQATQHEADMERLDNHWAQNATANLQAIADKADGTAAEVDKIGAAALKVAAGLKAAADAAQLLRDAGSTMDVTSQNLAQMLQSVITGGTAGPTFNDLQTGQLEYACRSGRGDLAR